ncbi:MAG: hypothetical protein JRI22_23705 [Deltaproteobacteria bacterium]|nr:hypothetical protein [Deltaproteobacteria bacterium]
MKERFLFTFIVLVGCVGFLMNPAPSGAAIKDDLDAGMSLRDAMVKARDEGKTCNEIMPEALEAVPDILVVVEAAIKAGVETVCCVVTRAIRAGGDPLAVANTAMAAGATLEDVQCGLAAGGYPRPEEYAYMPPGPPVIPLGPPSRIAGGVGAGGGGGRAASPTVPGPPFTPPGPPPVIPPGPPFPPPGPP